MKVEDEGNFSPIGGYEQTCSHLKRDQLTSSKIACSISKSFWVSEILPVPKSRASISTGAMSFATTTRKGEDRGLDSKSGPTRSNKWSRNSHAHLYIFLS